MKNIFSILFLGLSLFAYSQNTLKGKITTTENTSISGVQITLPELGKETTSDASGNYSFTNLPNGNFTISFFIKEYDPYSSTVSIKTTEVIYDVTLSEVHSHHMDEIIVSTVFNKLQKENVMKVEHSSIKDLKQKGAVTLVDGLATIPGVSNVSTGTSIGKPVIRGLSGNRVLVYTQGVRLENQQFGEEHGLGLNDNGVESVEVIKGPASLLYGSDALGGVLYFNPEKFAKNNEQKANFSQRYFTNTQGYATGFGFKSSGNKWRFMISGNHNSHIDYKTSAKSNVSDSLRVTNSRFTETDAKIALGYQTTAFSSTFRYNINNLDLGLPEAIGEQTTKRELDSPKQKIVGQVLSWNSVIYLKESKIETNFGYVLNNRKEIEDVPLLDMNLKTFNYDLKYFFPKKGNLETIVGVQGMSQSNKNYGEETLIPDAKTNDIGVLVTSNYTWGKNTIQGGIRFDNRTINSETHGEEGEEGYFKALDRSFKSFNGSLGYKTNFTDNLVLRLNLASGFRAPNLAELTSNGVHEGSNRYEIGNADLKNEQNFQADLNLEYGNTHFEVFANGFYNYIKNYIYISPTGDMIDTNFVYDYVQSNAKLFGGEVGIHIHPHPIDWLHITSSFESVTGKKDNGDYLPLIPANKIVNNLKVNFKSANWFKESYLSATVETNLKQNKVSPFETETNDYTLVNLGAGGTFDFKKLQIEAFVSANNVLDRSYIAHLSRLKADGIPNIGRNIVFGLNFHF